MQRLFEDYMEKKYYSIQLGNLHLSVLQNSNDLLSVLLVI